MKTRAAVLRDMGKDWEIIEMDLDPPRDGEVLIRFAVAGLCHSDDHLRTGDIPVRYPIVGGHEGAGIVEQAGGGSRLEPGDHVVCSFLPTCGHCRFCASGMTNLCDLGALFFDNCLPDGTFRFHADGEDFGQLCSARFRSGQWCPSTPASRSTTTCRWRRWRWSAADAVREADPGRAVRQRQPVRHDPAAARAVPGGAAQAGGAGHEPLLIG
jgi:Alcohol dehydrogenase GroES-like domain